MWSSVANLKESLSKIAHDVHDDDSDEELAIYTPNRRDRIENGDSVSERRISRSFDCSSSPIPNGLDSPFTPEIHQYESEIKRLQESEAEIKALSVNYAALLKEKEVQMSKLAEENDSLKQNLQATNAALSATKIALKGSGDISPHRQNRTATRIRSAGSPQANGSNHKHDGLSSGTTSDNSKELLETTECKHRSHLLMQATHDTQMKQIMAELDKERGKLVDIQRKLLEEQKLNESFQKELSLLKDDKNEMMKEIQKTHDELSKKISEIGELEMNLQRRNSRDTSDFVEKLKKRIATLEDDNKSIKKEKEEYEAALVAIRASPVRRDIPSDTDSTNKHSSNKDEGFPGMEEMQQSLQKLEKDLKETQQQRDKAFQELNRLKQHLLEKESEESEKMDNDSKIIEELQEINDHQRVKISRLENALKQAISGQEEIKLSNDNELKNAKETISELNRKLNSCMSTLDAKNLEVLNLQTALGQYYAEVEAKERLAEELSLVKEESNRLAEQLKEAKKHAETSKTEKEEILGLLSQSERLLADGKNRVKKLEEDNEKLRRALEQSMTRLNRMSVESDFLVDRRIVIKLLVTYFQRNHSKEVLDLMVRMLGFSDEDKQRIGLAQQGAGKGVVRGVLGLPGRLVGGILGSSSTEASPAMASDNQTFADLWVDFLLSETEREKRESSSSNATTNEVNPDHQQRASTSSSPPSSSDHRASIPRSNPYHTQNHIPPSSSRGDFMRRENSDSEFSTVPLTSSESTFQGLLRDN